MKTIKLRFVALILFVAALASAGFRTSEKNPNEKSMQKVVVLLKFKAQELKGEETVSQLTDLLENVKDEPHFIGIKLHVDPNDDTNIFLYEEWENEDYYNTTHMDTDHIKEFMANSKNFLMGPPEITFWKMEKEFK